MPRDPKAGRFSQSNTVAVRVRQPLEVISLSRSSWLSDSHKDLTLRACEFIDGQGRPLKFLPRRVGLSHMASLLMIPPPSQRLLRRDGGGGPTGPEGDRTKRFDRVPLRPPGTSPI